MKVIEKHKKAILVAFFFFLFIRLKNNNAVSKKFKFTEQMAKEALQRFALKNKERAKLIEKMYRAETDHFKSWQFKVTGTAGMEDGPWGNTLKKYFPNGYTTYQLPDNDTKVMKKFIIWNSIDDVIQFMSDYIDRHKGDYLDWNDMHNSVRRAKYQNLLNSIKNRFVI